MKFSVISYIGLLFIKLKFMPNVSILGWVFIAVGVDFMTGVLKAKLNKQLINSQGFRQTAIKCLQYMGLIVGGIIIGNAFEKDSDIVIWVNNGMLLFITYVEVYSIFENLYAMNPDSKVATFCFKPAMRILTIGLEKNSLVPIANAEDAAKANEDAIRNTLVDAVNNTGKTVAVILLAASILLLSSCTTVKPAVNSSYEKKDTTITDYVPADVQYNGATVYNSVNNDSMLSAFAILLERLEAASKITHQSINVDSVLNAFKSSFKQPLHDTVTVTDPATKVQLKYWYDVYGKLQLSCSSKDEQIQALLAQVTKLTTVTKATTTTNVVYKMPWWGWVLCGIAVIPILIAIMIAVSHLAQKK